MKKSALVTLLVAGLFAGAANAATLVNNSGVIGITVGSSLNTSNPYNYLFDYAYGGDVTFTLYPTVHSNTPVTYSLSDSTGVIYTTTLNALNYSTASFVKNLAAGTYSLNISTAAAAATTEISAVPLPGAALLFASSLFGAGALRRRKEKEVVAA